jgi:hypothetical protein
MGGKRESLGFFHHGMTQLSGINRALVVAEIRHQRRFQTFQMNGQDESCKLPARAGDNLKADDGSVE